MPKTYNQRQIDQIRLEDAHTPQARDAPDVTRFIRYFSSEEVRQIVRRLEQSVAAGKVTQLKPETAYLVVQALRGWNAKPSRELKSCGRFAASRAAVKIGVSTASARPTPSCSYMKAKRCGIRDRQLRRPKSKEAASKAAPQ